MSKRFNNLEINENQKKEDAKPEDGLKLNCPACGRLYQYSDQFCSNCGGDLRRIQKKKVSGHRGLGKGKVPEVTKKTKKPPNPPKEKISKDEYKKKYKKNLAEFSYKYFFIIVIALMLLLAYLKPNWFSIF